MRDLLLAAIPGLACAAALAQDNAAWVDVTPPGVSPGESVVMQLAVHPTDARRLIAAKVQGGVAVSNDRGVTWTRPPTPPGLETDVVRLFAHPGRPGVVFLQEKGGGYFERIAVRTDYVGGRLYRSDDFGATWTLILGRASAERPFTLSPFAVDPLAPERIFATRRSLERCLFIGCEVRGGNWDEGLFESVDGGRSWREVAGVPLALFATDGESIEGPTLAASRRLFFVAWPRNPLPWAPPAVYVSEDSAASWHPFASGFDWIRQDPGNAHVLYGSWTFGLQLTEAIQRSDDGGRTWREVLTVPKFEAGPKLPTALKVDPVRRGRLWLTSVEQGVLLSEDSGAHWRNLGLAASRSGDVIYPAGIAQGLVSSPADPETVYVLWSGKVMRYQLPAADLVGITEFESPDRYWMSRDDGETLSQRYRIGVDGFVPTGASFLAWRPDRAPAGALGSCRFQGNPAYGQHSRFITLAGAECESLKSSPAWVLEGENEFFAMPAAGGQCAAGLVPVKRFFNGQADANHRYVADPVLARTMRERGWIEEGTAMCGSAAGP